MRIVNMYRGSGVCFCCFIKVIAVYPNSAVIPTSIRVDKFPLCIKDGTLKLIEKPI